MFMPAKNPKEYAINHYLANKGKYAQQSKDAKARKREWYNDFMSDKSCAHCSESDVVVLEWHHLDPSQKDMAISAMMTQRGKETILEEIDKCMCLCANCHRRLHHNLRNI
jgi:hypothetical protein